MDASPSHRERQMEQNSKMSNKRSFAEFNKDRSPSISPSSISPSLSPDNSRRPSTSLEESTNKSRSVMEDMGNSGLWVFGYGSLCWLQGFDYSEAQTGCVLGFSRRFWQGNITHRGTQQKPGLVATLVDDSEGVVWGQAYRVQGDAALPYLNSRECEMGGYRTSLATFYPRDTSLSPFPAMLYIATPNNRHWLGEQPLSAIAGQIIECEGASGHNVEYLLRLANFMRDRIPEAHDDHLFELEALVRRLVEERRLCLSTLMGEEPGRAVRDEEPGPAQQPPSPAAEPNTSSQFSNRVPSKKLRCVNI